MLSAYQTERLDIREWSADLGGPTEHPAFLKQLRSVLTSTVLAHLPEPLQIETQGGDLEKWIEDRNAESTVLAVKSRKSGDLIGLLILAEFVDEDASATLHIGYLLGEQHWGQGYASELIAGVVCALREQGKPIRIVGGVEAGNPASARVLAKNDFKPIGDQGPGDNIMYALDIVP